MIKVLLCGNSSLLCVAFLLVQFSCTSSTT